MPVEPMIFACLRLEEVMKAVLLTALVLAAAGPSAAHAQQPTDSMPGRPMMQGAEMRAMMDSSDARLDRLLATMNAAKGDRKVKAMADVINELVAERRQMRDHMRQMMDGGMQRGPGGPGGGGMMHPPGTMHPPGAMHPEGMPHPPKPDSTTR